MVPFKAILAAFFIFILGAALQGCGFYHEKQPGDPNSIVPGTVTWAQVSAEVLQPRCSMCHSVGGAGFNSSSYLTVVHQIQQVQDRSITRQRMPPDSPLTAYERALLLEWINEGTPE